VLFGSSDKLGVGTNVQTLLIAMHHIDAPWKPAQVEQRDGRGLRQGNLNPEIHIYRYVTKRSFDAFMWQKLDTKAKFIGQLISGTKGSRSAEDIDNPLPEAAEMKAAASGDPRILEHAELGRKLNTLQAQKRSFEKTKSELSWQVKKYQERVNGGRSGLQTHRRLPIRSRTCRATSSPSRSTARSSPTAPKQARRSSASSSRIWNRFQAAHRLTYRSRSTAAFRSRRASTSIMTHAPAIGLLSSTYRGRRAANQVSLARHYVVDKDSTLDHFTRKLDTVLSDIKNQPGWIAERAAEVRVNLDQGQIGI
jgi:hypothetical protein